MTKGVDECTRHGQGFSACASCKRLFCAECASWARDRRGRYICTSCSMEGKRPDGAGPLWFLEVPIGQMPKGDGR